MHVDHFLWALPLDPLSRFEVEEVVPLPPPKEMDSRAVVALSKEILQIPFHFHLQFLKSSIFMKCDRAQKSGNEFLTNYFENSPKILTLTLVSNIY